jgi:SNF2 family DNA or RNA helicase
VVIAKMIRLQQLSAAYADIGYKTMNRRNVDTGQLEPYQKMIVNLIDPSAKLDALQERIEESVDQPLVIFTTFKGMVRLTCQRLDRMGISYSVLTGETPNDERGTVVSQFQDGTKRMFVGTIQAGGVGITLTRADQGHFLDRTWSPAINQQAEDRLHRIGQKNAVQIIDYVARDTVDLGRLQRLELKWNWIKRLLGDPD